MSKFVLAASAAVPIAYSLREPPHDGLEAKKRKARGIITKFMIVNGIPGLSIGVSKNGEKIWSEGFGYANIESSAKCSEDTVMRIASISKPITATIAARLIEAGKLDIDKDIRHYLPSFPEKNFSGKPVTITTRQLLSHSAGIRHYHNEKVINDN
ncbi:unnamed protein product [Caenorhabditis bovis]|uniref:Beta-lactamase-related domain-containing protein n=1 Tax=Caenorhabditis bovis TaxID=2654633 RepID=A0A8S1EZV6_9PELO|nr:unnamed protein product [Caenorhabditis bovis]